jgi:hypothetical protein
MRTRDEVMMEDIWQQRVLLDNLLILEASTLSRFFKSTEPIKHMHTDPEIRLKADSDVKMVDVTNKLFDLKATLKQGNAVLAVYPDGRRVLVKQQPVLEVGEFALPSSRQFAAGAGERTRFNIWTFSETGLIDKVESPFSGDSVRALRGPEDAKGGSNLTIKFFTSAPGRLFFIIPNSEFQSKSKMYKDAEAYVPRYSATGDEYKDRINTDIRSKGKLSNIIIQKYGKYIQKKIITILPSLKESIIKYMDSDIASDKELQQNVADYRRFLKFSKDISSLNFIEELEPFLQNVISNEETLKKYDAKIDRDMGTVFKTQVGMDKFIRDFVLGYIKTITPTHFEEIIANGAVDLF